MSSPNVMVVSHGSEFRAAIEAVLARRGLSLIFASTAQEAADILERQRISLVFCSDELHGGGADQLVRLATRPSQPVPVVVVSRLDDWKRYLEFLRAGAFDYILSPLSSVEVERVVKDALGPSVGLTFSGVA